MKIFRSILHPVAIIAVVASGLLSSTYYISRLGFGWPLSLLTEVWPYLVILPTMGWVLLVLTPTLRKKYLLLGFSTLFLVLNLFPVMNWYGMPGVSHQSNGLRVMTYNIWIYNQNYDAIAASIQDQDPDILLLTEVSSEAMSILKDRLTYTHSYRTTGGNNGLFSRYPILDARSDLLGVSIPGRTYNLVARLQLDKDEVTLVGFHPPIPPIRHLFHVRNRQLDALARYVQPLKEKVIVLGDFNTSPWSPYLRRFESKAFLKNAGQGRGIRATWNYHAKFPMSWLKVPIDHIEIRGFQVAHTWVGDSGGSDHAPIIATLETE